MPILELSHYLDTVLSGNYDWKQSRWYYPAAFGVDAGYTGKLEGSLKKGKYVLEVTDTEQKQHTGEFYINAVVKLPLISSKYHFMDDISIRVPSTDNYDSDRRLVRRTADPPPTEVTAT